MIKTVEHLCEEEACRRPGHLSVGVISITEPGRLAPIDAGMWGSVLRLQFSDIDRADVPIHNPVLFNNQMADQIFAWLERYVNTLEGVVVHCAAGISRSAAVAKFIAERYGLQFNEARASLYNRWVHRVLWDRWTQDEEVQRQILAARA
jgi:protein-tyrosine phosphatase